jgi:uncharacterized membrane protein
MYGFAKYYNDRAIFRNVVYGVISGIVGIIVLFAVIFLLVLSVSASPTNLITQTAAFTASALPIQTSPNLQAAISIIGVFAVLALGVVSVAIIQNVFFKRAFDHLAERSGEQRFRDAGLLMLIGGVLTVVLIGGIVVFVAWILATAGFFSMRKPANEVSPPAPYDPGLSQVQE